MDVDCGNFVGKNLQQALDQDYIKEADVDLALEHLFSLRLRLGLFDPPAVNPYAKLGPKDVNHTKHEGLALQAARESLILLKNKGGALPFTPKASNTTKIAVVGPNSDDGGTMQGVDCHGVPPYVPPHPHPPSHPTRGRELLK